MNVRALAAAEPVLPSGQVSAAQADGTLVLSGSRLLHEGARGAILLAPGLFRVDLCPQGDSIAMTVRNLAGGSLEVRGSGYGGPVQVSGGWLRAEAATASRHEAGFSIADEQGAVDVALLYATVRERSTGVARCSAQATVRHR